jgi:hypothetical protein
MLVHHVLRSHVDIRCRLEADMRAIVHAQGHRFDSDAAMDEVAGMDVLDAGNQLT